MTYSYEQRKPAQRQEEPRQRLTDRAQGSPTVIGADLSSARSYGHPVDLPGAIREKFENAFGADLSTVRFYRSQTVADAGAQAVAMGERVVFAPGMLDFSSRSGQTLLGHELSHVVAQQRGEVTGSGFLNDPVLEARADREGAMAAAGEQVSAPTAAMSSATAASASGPMQAKKDIQAMGRAYGQDNPNPEDSQLDVGNDLRTRNVYAGVGDEAVTANSVYKGTNYVNDYIKTGQQGLSMAAKFTDTHFARVDPDVLKKGTWGGTPTANGFAGVLGLGAGLISTYNGISSLKRGIQNVKVGGSKADPVEGGLETLAGLGTVGTGAGSLAKAVSSTAADALKAGGSLQNVMPWLSIGTGAVNTVLGTMQAIRGGKKWYDINQQIDAVKQRSPVAGEPTNDQMKMLRTMRHGKEVQKRNTILGGIKGVGGFLTGAGGVLSLGGATTPLGLGLSASGALVSGIGSVYRLLKNRSLRRNAIAEELGGMSYEQALAHVKETLGPNHGYISRRNAWKIFLESKGRGDNEDALYAEIRKRRAAHMLKMAQDGDQEAKAFIKSMGVDEVDLDGHGNMSYAEGALDLLTEKLK